MSASATTAGGYPVRFDVEYPERLSRLLIFVKWLLAIPHIVLLYFLALLNSGITFIAFFAILFTRRYPRGLFNIAVGINRWGQNVGAYLGLLRDEYPPFSWEAEHYPVTYEVEYPEQLSRWLIFVKWLLVIPHILVLLLLSVVAFAVYIIAWFAILFGGGMPRGLFSFLVGYTRWTARVNAYAYFLTDKYPPFSLS